jgi:hypothetical protein
VWQLVKIHLLNSINLKNHPELVRLLEAGEELADLLKLPPDQLLLRWYARSRFLPPLLCLRSLLDATCCDVLWCGAVR